MRLAAPLSALLILSGASAAAAGGDFEIRRANVAPGLAYFAGEPVVISFAAADERERSLNVTLIEKRSRDVVHRWTVATKPDAAHFRLRWSGKVPGGGIARNGIYLARAGPAGRPSRKLGAFEWRRFAYPVDGPHGVRGYWGEFGAPRSGGRTHQGFDITADCGTRIVAARGGRVMRSEFDSELHGNFVVIRGRVNGVRQWYSHLSKPSPMGEGDRVDTGRLVGRIGKTGNAAGTPCHLHFELRRDGPIDPEPYLRRWDR